MDRRLEAEVLARFSQRTMQPPQALIATTLSTLEGLLTRKLTRTSHTRWVLPFGLWRRKRRLTGIPYCPQCLSDGEPYYRLSWRCSFAPACPRHGTLLREVCPHCLTGVLFHKLEFGPGVKNALTRTPITTCWRCQGDVREADIGEKAHPLTLWTQSLFGAALSEGVVTLGGSRVAAIEFAEVSYELLGLLCRGRSTEEFRILVAEAAGVLASSHGAAQPGSAHRYLEGLPTAARAQALAMLGWVLQEWPVRLVSVAKAARLSRSQFTRHLAPEMVPGWYRQALLPLTTGYRRPRARKVFPEAAVPTSGVA